MRLLPLVDKISQEESSSPWVAPYVVLSCFILRKASLEVDLNVNYIEYGISIIKLNTGLLVWRMVM